MESWLIYALGGGWGHLIRALSLGRLAARTRSVTLLTNSPYAAYVTDREPVIVRAIDLAASPAQAALIVQHILRETCCSHLVIDTFPRGLGGELAELLPELSCLKILIHRDLNPNYVKKMNLVDFVAAHFDLILIPGENLGLPFAHLPQVRVTAPWFIRLASELPDRGTIATILNLSPTNPQPTVLVIASGQLEELAWYGQVTQAISKQYPHLFLRCLSPFCPPHCPPQLWQKHFPALELLAIADLVIGSGGYNTVHECQALGIPLMSKPFQRLYDRQLRRLQRIPGSGVKIVHNLEAVLEGFQFWLQGDNTFSSEQNSPYRLEQNSGYALKNEPITQVLPSRRMSLPSFANGAVEANQHITRLS